MEYNYYIALDFSKATMAIAYLKDGEKEIKTIVERTTIKGLKYFLSNLDGPKVLTFEETTPAHWLYCELQRFVDKIIVCDPYYNSFLGTGSKSDRVDATRLLKLLKNDLLTPVFHSWDKFFAYRSLVSIYEDTVKEGVRWKNRLAAHVRRCGGWSGIKKYNNSLDNACLETLFERIESNDRVKKRYQEMFCEIVSSSKHLSALKSIPGIGSVGAIKIAATVVDPKRFPSRGHFWSYCGLVLHRKISGDRSYGYRRPRHSSRLKSVYKTAALAAIHARSDNAFKRYYKYLTETCGRPAHIARHEVAKKIAEVSLVILRTGQRFRASKLKKVVREGEQSSKRTNS